MKICNFLVDAELITKEIQTKVLIVPVYLVYDENSSEFIKVKLCQKPKYLYLLCSLFDGNQSNMRYLVLHLG